MGTYKYGPAAKWSSLENSLGLVSDVMPMLGGLSSSALDSRPSMAESMRVVPRAAALCDRTSLDDTFPIEICETFVLPMVYVTLYMPTRAKKWLQPSHTQVGIQV